MSQTLEYIYLWMVLEC